MPTLQSAQSDGGMDVRVDELPVHGEGRGLDIEQLQVAVQQLVHGGTRARVAALVDCLTSWWT